MSESGGNIILTGFMASGKTTVGRLLAKTLGRAFFDTDAIVEKKTQKTVADIFASEGESAFRGYEADAVASCAAEENAVISLGGGAVFCENIAKLKESGVIVWLFVTADAVLERTRDGTGRPLLHNKDETAVEQMINARAAAYKRLADVTIDTSALSAAECANEIIRRINTISRLKYR